MAVENRDLGTTQQRETYQITLGAGASGLVGVGTTAVGCIVPFPSTLAAGQAVGFGLSGTPALNLDVTRYNAGGVTTITGMISAYTVFGATIGAQNGFTVSSGTSLVNLQTNDVISLRTSGANTAATQLAVCLVVQALQDIKKHFNV